MQNVGGVLAKFDFHMAAKRVLEFFTRPPSVEKELILIMP